VAREVQDPFGFDENDLNVQGYEISTIENVSVMINGPLRVRTALMMRCARRLLATAPQ
jgi:predicted membrane chloride channel (bestrophin family)